MKIFSRHNCFPLRRNREMLFSSLTNQRLRNHQQPQHSCLTAQRHEVELNPRLRGVCAHPCLCLRAHFAQARGEISRIIPHFRLFISRRYHYDFGSASQGCSQGEGSLWTPPPHDPKREEEKPQKSQVSWEYDDTITFSATNIAHFCTWRPSERNFERFFFFRRICHTTHNPPHEKSWLRAWCVSHPSGHMKLVRCLPKWKKAMPIESVPSQHCRSTFLWLWGSSPNSALSMACMGHELMFVYSLVCVPYFCSHCAPIHKRTK